MSMIDVNAIASALNDIKYMAEIAAETSDSLSSAGAQPGFFQISVSDGNRLGFCCNDILRRVGELLAFVGGK
jgi:hypothetical protein